jgi:hypothetical protein
MWFRIEIRGRDDRKKEEDKIRKNRRGKKKVYLEVSQKWKVDEGRMGETEENMEKEESGREIRVS